MMDSLSGILGGVRHPSSWVDWVMLGFLPLASIPIISALPHPDWHLLPQEMLIAGLAFAAIACLCMAVWYWRDSKAELKELTQDV